MVTSAIRSTKLRYYMHKAALLMKPDCPSAKWWKAAKELTGQAVDVKGVPPLQDTKGAFVYDEKGKAALLRVSRDTFHFPWKRKFSFFSL